LTTPINPGLASGVMKTATAVCLEPRTRRDGGIAVHNPGREPGDGVRGPGDGMRGHPGSIEMAVSPFITPGASPGMASGVPGLASGVPGLASGGPGDGVRGPGDGMRGHPGSIEMAVTQFTTRARAGGYDDAGRRRGFIKAWRRVVSIHAASD
jgi:hypothetical protein